MSKPWIAALSLLAVTSVLGAQALAPEEGRDLATEVAELNLTLLEIRDLLAQQVETDSLDLLLKRSELVSAEVARLETALREVQAQRDSLAEDETRVRIQIEAAEDQLRSADAPAEQLEGYLRQMEFELDSAGRRMRALEGEIQELQNRLTARQRDLQSWQDLVDRRLGGV
jgi:chromosome segregation ATPase